MTRYVWRDGRFRDPITNEPMPVPERDGVCCPLVQSDIAEYNSPINGALISSRSSRREDLKRNDCVEIDPPKKPRGYKNPTFARKRGLQLREDVRDTMKI